jgi:hypothetical protein
MDANQVFSLGQMNDTALPLNLMAQGVSLHNNGIVQSIAFDSLTGSIQQLNADRTGYLGIDLHRFISLKIY